jgi:hypothetical protein
VKVKWWSEGRESCEHTGTLHSFLNRGTYQGGTVYGVVQENDRFVLVNQENLRIDQPRYGNHSSED